MTNRLLVIMAFLPLACSAYGSGQGAVVSKAADSQPATEFLARLAGKWEMSGRAWPAKGAAPYRTASTMSAQLRIGQRALVRDIEAAVIGLEALDVLSYSSEKHEFTYYYMSSVRPEPLILRGTKGAGDELRLFLKQDGRTLSRTVIRLTGPDEMVATDYLIGADGEEWMSREVFHTRVQ